MIGIVIAGPWLTAQAARLFGRLARGSSALLAARRLADNPTRAYRAVAGAGLIVPAVNSTDQTPAAGALSNILVGRVELPAAAGTAPHWSPSAARTCARCQRSAGVPRECGLCR